MEYTRNEILTKCQEALANVENFYKAGFINYRGLTCDTKERYSEVVAEFVCGHLGAFDGIRTIRRETSYKTPGHDGVWTAGSNRVEEITAMQMYTQCRDGRPYHGIGQIIDYQTPLKNKKSDDAGKIDLLSVREDTLFLLELKREDSTETMLRCVLEGYTYLKTADIPKLLADFCLTGIRRVCASPLVFQGGNQWQEMREARPWLRRLMGLLDCQAYYVHRENDQYVITED